MKEKIVDKYKESIGKGQGTLGIILINIVIFIAINTVPNISEKFLLNYEISMILEKPWTLVTVFFSHEVYLHIIINMAIFFCFGLELEKITNEKTVVIVYVIAGLIGSLAFPFTRSVIERTGLIAGASAAVLGIVGAYTALRPNTVLLGSKAKNWVLAVFIFSILLATIYPQSLDSTVAHLAGVVVGLICGYRLRIKEVKIKN